MLNDNLDAINELSHQLILKSTTFNTQFYKNHPEMIDYNLRRLKNNQMDLVYDWYGKVAQFYNTDLSNYNAIYPFVSDLQSRFKITSRVKSNFLNKLNLFLDTSSYLVVSKYLNDIYGCRIILSDVRSNEDELFKILKNSKQFYRVVQRYDDMNLKRPSKYHAIHCYLQLHNYDLPWEIQIWDQLDEIHNINDHLKHEKRRGY